MNFDGPVRVVETAGEGTATVTLSFDAWKGAKVGPTTHSVPVLPPKPGPKSEATASNLITSLTHPERKASVWTIQFSPDGARLFAAGYPSGIVQIWDVTSRKEVRRIDTPPGYRGSANYAVLAPDWKTLYVPIEKRTVKPFERDGKKLYRIKYSGEIRVWAVATGKEKEPLRPEAESAPVTAKLSPDGRFLVSVERPSHENTDNRPKEMTFVWDVAGGKKRKLGGAYSAPQFLPDGKTAAVTLHDHQAKTSAVKLLDLSTGKELASAACPEKDRYFSLSAVSPDGAVVAVSLGGKKGAPLEVWFLDGKTLEERGKLVGKSDPDRHGWGRGQFTPDSKRYIALGDGKALVWDVPGAKLERTLDTGAARLGWWSALSPDGKTLAVGWMPKLDPDLENERDPDPADLPQPRVSLIGVTGDAPPRVLVAPHGYVGGLAFAPDGKTLAFGGSGAVHLFDLTK